MAQTFLGPAATKDGPVAILVKGYPRLSETFIAQELLALQRHGLDFTIVSLRRPTDRLVHPLHRAIRAPVFYLPEYLHRAPRRVLRAWWQARRLPGWAAACRAWLADLRRDPTRNRVRRFGQALVLAVELGGRHRHLHAHFLHTPSSVARYAALLCGRPWSVSAHAKDIWTTPDWEKREKLADAAWGVTCTRHGHGELDRLAPGRVALCYHGLDLSRFPAPGPRPACDGGDPARPVRLLSVGRAVEKKGFEVLLPALAGLPPGCHWRWTHIGGGPSLAALRRRGGRLGLDVRIDWRGPRDQGDVIAALAAADLFVLPSRIARDGDRDGLPNVLLEAGAMELCCLASDVAGVGELIAHDETGWLVPPGDPAALAAALRRLIADPARRRRLGRACGALVRARFHQDASIGLLLTRFGLDGTRARTGAGRRDAAA